MKAYPKPVLQTVWRKLEKSKPEIAPIMHEGRPVARFRDINKNHPGYGLGRNSMNNGSRSLPVLAANKLGSVTAKEIRDQPLPMLKKLSERLDNILEFKNKSGIHIKKENRGKFTATKEKTGKTTAELAKSKNPKTRARANFARMAKRHWKPLNNSDPSKAIEFAGGYVNTGIGVRKEKGVGGHFNRNAGKYITGGLLLPALPLGALADHLRKKKSIEKTRSENVVGPDLAKGHVYEAKISSRLDELIQFDSRPRNSQGEFQNQEEGAPDPNAMDKVYHEGIAEGAGAAGVGAAALPLTKALLARAAKNKIKP